MPAQSQQQQKLFGLALSVKRGETPRSEASEDVLGIVDSMSEKEIEDFAGTSHKGLPKKVEEYIREEVRRHINENIPRMYKVYLGVQNKLRKLEDEQKKMLGQFKDEKDPKKKRNILDKMKDGTVRLKKVRANLADIEREYINKAAYDTSYSENIKISKDDMEKLHSDGEVEVDGEKVTFEEGKKRFRQQDGIGKAKYTISYHDGKQKHKDGSDFFGIQIFKNKKDLETFRNALLKKGYIEESINEAKIYKVIFAGMQEKDAKDFFTMVDRSPKIKAMTKDSGVFKVGNEVTIRFGVSSKQELEIIKKVAKLEGLKIVKIDESVNEGNVKLSSSAKKFWTTPSKKLFGGGYNLYDTIPPSQWNTHPEIIDGFGEDAGVDIFKGFIRDNIDGKGYLDSKIAKMIGLPTNVSIIDYLNDGGSGLNGNKNFKKYGNWFSALYDIYEEMEKKFGKMKAESINEGIEPQIKKIAYFTGTRPEAVEDFVSKHALNFTKLLKYVEKGGLPQRMELVSALAGRPNNPKQKKIIKQFQESVNEVNTRLNKKVKSYLDAYLKGEKKNSPEHQHAIMLIMKGALTDANFHSEARQLDKFFPKAKQSKHVGTPMEDVIEDKGVDIAGWAKWDGYDIIDAFSFYTNMVIGGGFGKKLETLKESVNEDFNSKDRTFEKVYSIFDKKDYFNAKGLAKVQIGNFERALQKNDKGAQQILDKFKGDMDKAKDYIIQVITDRKKEDAFNQYKAFKAAVDSIQKGNPIYGAVDLVKSRIHNNSQKYTIALYSALRNQKFTKWKDIHNDIDSLIK